MGYVPLLSPFTLKIPGVVGFPWEGGNIDGWFAALLY